MCVNGEILEKITEGNELDATTLLFTRPFDVKFNEFHVVTSIQGNDSMHFWDFFVSLLWYQ